MATSQTMQPGAARGALPFGRAPRKHTAAGGDLRAWESGRSVVIVVDDDQLVADGIVAMLERDDRTVIVCNDAESAKAALEEFPFTHLVSDLQLSMVPFEGMNLVGAARLAQPESRIVAVTGYGSHIVKSAALAVGADVFLSKPFEREDIEAALAEPAEMRRAGSGEGVLLHVRTVDALLASHSLEAHFQPVVALQPEVPERVGFEALARAGSNWPFTDMRSLFDYAGRVRRGVQLNAACVEAAFRAGAGLAKTATLFVNVDPLALAASGFADTIRRSAEKYGVDLAHVVVELTENTTTCDLSAVVRNARVLRAAGVQFALDDAESALTNLALAEDLRPAYLKISHQVGESFHEVPAKLDAVTKIVGLARLIGARVVLEGVETRATMEAARDAGIELGQGFWLGKPAPAEEYQERG